MAAAASPKPKKQKKAGPPADPTAKKMWASRLTLGTIAEIDRLNTELKLESYAGVLDLLTRQTRFILERSDAAPPLSEADLRALAAACKYAVFNPAAVGVRESMADALVRAVDQSRGHLADSDTDPAALAARIKALTPFEAIWAYAASRAAD